MDNLFPLMLDFCFFKSTNTSNLISYVDPLKEYLIEPFKLNMFHFYAFNNYSICIEEALECDQKYITDSFGNSPLKYALDRNACQSVE